MTQTKQKIVRQAGIYSAATVLTQIITLGAAILSRRFLGATQTGIWALLQVVMTYVSLSALGATNATTREVPFYLGKGDSQRAERIKNIVFCFSLGSTTLIAAGILVYAFLFRSSLRPELFWGLLAVSGLTILQRINDLLITILRAYKQFEIAGRQMVYSAFFNAAVIAWFSYRYRIYGFMFAMFLSFCFNIAYMVWRYPFRIRWDWDNRMLRDLIGYGLPLMLLGMLGTIFLSIDKIMITKFLGFRELGLYGIAILGASYLGKIPNSISAVLVPNFHEKFGERENKADLTGYLNKACSGLSTIMPQVVCGAWIFAPWVIARVLPEFYDSVTSVRILALSPFFLSLANPCENFLITIRRHLYLFPVIVSMICLAVLLNLAALRQGYGIEGVALATMLVTVFKFFAVYFMSVRQLGAKRLGLSRLSKILFKFGWMLAALFAAGFLLPSENFGGLCLQWLFVFCLHIPFLWRFVKGFDILKLFRGKDEAAAGA